MVEKPIVSEDIRVGIDWVKDMREGMILIFYILIRVWVSQMYSFVKTQNIYLRFLHFIICIFYIKTVNRY